MCPRNKLSSRSEGQPAATGTILTQQKNASWRADLQGWALT